MKKTMTALLVACALQAHALPLTQLQADEKNTVEIFQQHAAQVVYVHRLATVINAYDQVMDVAAGSGSGFVWDGLGHVVTNFHVVKDADKLVVTLGNQTLPAQVVGVEPYKDIAVLKIDLSQYKGTLPKLQPFVLAPTHELLVGQKAIAIGNPFGLDHSLTVGVISALGRQVPGISGVRIRNMIQTDASINPGNSGGPLLDSQGHLIGMNTAIFSPSGSSAGVGFAVPADDIGRLVPELIKHGRIVMAGIGIARVSPSLAQSLGVTRGVLIGEVLPRTPAARAGLRGTHRAPWGGIQVGDVILGINGHEVANYDALYQYLTDVQVGQSVTLSILRNQKVFEIRLKTIDIGSY